MKLFFSPNLGKLQIGINVMNVLMHRDSLEFYVITEVAEKYLIIFNLDTNKEQIINREHLSNFVLGGAC